MPTKVKLTFQTVGNFNPGNGTTAGQKIFLGKTKGLETETRLKLNHLNAQKLMEILKVEEQVKDHHYCCPNVQIRQPEGNNQSPPYA